MHQLIQPSQPTQLSHSMQLLKQRDYLLPLKETDRADSSFGTDKECVCEPVCREKERAFEGARNRMGWRRGMHITSKGRKRGYSSNWWPVKAQAEWKSAQPNPSSCSGRREQKESSGSTRGRGEIKRWREWRRRGIIEEKDAFVHLGWVGALVISFVCDRSICIWGSWPDKQQE